MAYIPEDIIQQVRQQADLVEIINEYVQLEKHGNNYTCSCPFHEDRNPSFSVQPTKQIFKCFSCGRGGNVFTFLQEIEGISFVEAVKKAAELGQVEVDGRYFESDNSQQTQFTHLYELHQKVADFYHYYLMNTKGGASGLDYLLKRSLTQATLEEFGLGLAPDNPDTLKQYLYNEGYDKENLLQSGIFVEQTSGELVDRFRGRIIVPLKNEQGKVVAFSGRIFAESTLGHTQAKYVNSPETAIFKKSHLVYNLDKAKPHIRQRNQVLVCEGYMDVIALSQAGFKQAVATMGTSMTSQHLQILTKLAPAVLLVFDGDQAGQDAIARVLEMGQSQNFNQLKAVTIPYQLDPDEWIKQKGPQSFTQLLQQAISPYDFFKDYLQRQYNLKQDKELAAYIEALIQHIARINSPIEKELRIHDLAQTYQLNEALLNEQLLKIQDKVTATRQASRLPNKKLNDAIKPQIHHQKQLSFIEQRALQSEKYLIAQLIFQAEMWQFVEQLPSSCLTLYHELSQKAYVKLDEYYYAGNPMPLIGIVNQIEELELNHFMNDVIWEYEDLPYDDQSAQICLRHIEKAFMEKEVIQLRQALKEAQLNQDMNQVSICLNQIMQLTKEMK